MTADSLVRDPLRAPVRVAAVLGFLGVGLGAFGAHGLKGALEAQGLGAAQMLERMDWWETAAFYHLIHAVVLAVGGVVCALSGRRSTGLTVCLALGVTIFSGTLYGMALGAPRWFGAITPVGGVLLMAGWVTLFLACRGNAADR